jgi:hypothetical protein
MTQMRGVQSWFDVYFKVFNTITDWDIITELIIANTLFSMFRSMDNQLKQFIRIE